MQPEDQRTQTPRYAVTPRTLTFLQHQDQLLLLRGAPHKKLWAGKVNGLGGHVEPGEDIIAAARRELLEETGLEVAGLTLRAVITITLPTPPGVLLFVFTGSAPLSPLKPSAEGELFWADRHELGQLPLVEDLTELLPRILTPGPLIYGHYLITVDGLTISWNS